jgi:hypothetical protein
VAPNNSKYVVDAYKEATKEPYSYMLFDFHQSTPDMIRVRSNMMPREREKEPMKAWLPRSGVSV